METVAVLECPWCGEALDEEEAEDPRRDEHGGIICDECWDEEYRAVCQRCEEYHDKTDLPSEPGSVVAVWRPACGLSGRVRRGYYRVKRWPFFMHGMIEAFFLNDALERLGPLDARGREAGKYAETAAGPMCPKCRGEVEAHLRARAA